MALETVETDDQSKPGPEGITLPTPESSEEPEPFQQEPVHVESIQELEPILPQTEPIEPDS